MPTSSGTFVVILVPRHIIAHLALLLVTASSHLSASPINMLAIRRPSINFNSQSFCDNSRHAIFKDSPVTFIANENPSLSQLSGVKPSLYSVGIIELGKERLTNRVCSRASITLVNYPRSLLVILELGCLSFNTLAGQHPMFSAPSYNWARISSRPYRLGTSRKHQR
jgi:hypothetical protein